MTEQQRQTRLDGLWRAVAETGAEADWLRFYEGFAVQRLIVPMHADGSRPLTLELEDGAVALAFGSEDLFSAFISGPTEHVTLTGADLAGALAPLGIGVALNPGVAPGETVLRAEALAWIAERGGAEVALETLSPGARIGPPVAPEAALLEGLGSRLAEMPGHVAEAWLIGAEERGGQSHLCVLRLGVEAADLGSEIAAELTRIGQTRAARPFAVALSREGSALLAAARRHGIGLVREDGRFGSP